MEGLGHFILVFGAQKLGDATVGEVDDVDLKGLAAEPPWAQDHSFGDRRLVRVEDAGQKTRSSPGGIGRAD